MKLQWTLRVLLGAVILLIPSLINGYSFLYSDTGTYIEIGFDGYVSHIRPVMYGFFMRHASLMESLWFVLLAQAILMSWSIANFLKVFFLNLPVLFFLGLIGLLTATTSIGVCTGMLMPDFFTAVIFLHVAILLFAEQSSKWQILCSSAVIVFRLACHHSHPYILFATLVALMFLKFLLRNRFKLTATYRRLIWVTGLAVLGYFLIPTMYYARAGKFIRSESSNVFLVSRLNQMGLLSQFLDENCASSRYDICAYKDELPENFLWSKSSPVYKDGGWVVNNEVYGEMLKDFFSNGKFIKSFMWKTIYTVFDQFFTFDTVVIRKEKESSHTYFAMNRLLPEEISPSIKSKQFKETWSSNFIDWFQRIMVFGGGLLLLFGLFFDQSDSNKNIYRQLILYILLALLANALICGGVSMVVPRFQSRVAWMIPMFAFALLYTKFQKNNLTQ